MEAFKVKRELWAFKLDPQLMGKVQQAFATMDRTKTTDYNEVKVAILRCYDISEETYRQWFRSVRRTGGEGYLEHGQYNTRRWIGYVINIRRDIRKSCQESV